MIMMTAAGVQPVSPLLFKSTGGSAHASAEGPGGPGGAEEEDIDPNSVAHNDPITGVEITVLDEDGPGALEPKPLSTPPDMTPTQKAKHDLLHLPMHLGCLICRARKTPNTYHFQSNESERLILARRGRLLPEKC